MGRRYESGRHDRDEVNIDIGRYPGRSSSKRYADSAGAFYEDTTSSKGCCARLSRRKRVVIARLIEFIFVVTAVAVASIRVAKPPDPAYPPAGTGDHGTLTFMLAAGGLGVASFFVGICSVCNCCNKSAEKGPKRCGLRYIPMYVDIIFIGLATGAIFYAIQILGNEGTHCLENMGAYPGCVMLMAAVVMTALGAFMAFICSLLEFLRIREWKKTSRVG